MSQYVLENPNWEPFALQRINEIISKNGTSNPISRQDQPYAVFDFDNTSCFFDIEDHLVLYLIHKFAIKVSEEKLYEILTAGPYDIKQPLMDGRELLTIEHLAKDIVHYFGILKKEQGNLDLIALRKTCAYQLFRTKLLAHYYYCMRLFSPASGENWLTYWFAGYTVEDFTNFASEMLDWALQLPIKKVRYSTEGLEKGFSGSVTVDMEQGLRFPDEIRELYKVLRNNKIATYIITASPQLLGQVAAKHYKVPASHVFGVQVQLENGRLTSKIATEALLTKGIGKLETIKQKIAPLHRGNMPIMAFGDSAGDYHMLSQIEDLQLGVLFNRGNEGMTQEIIQKGIRLYQQSQAPLVVQGRDENLAVFRPSQSSVLLDSKTETLLL
ncbi:HAD family hydrolase [Streptococcus merionis]|uniref:phosphoserine phosphatase n=1 Tax=Streptococcus merionis TaxID=400065 RepID=A0A239SPT8_9STRE|nr:HAD family hydrolase [Streptococcus merionis]SNU86653.1 HAD phosphoserine phosphatase-like hydrolase, family IB [Streptococcus merionis]